MAGKTYRELAAETTPALNRLIATQDATSGQPTKSTLTQLFAVLPATENAALADMAQATIKGRAAAAGTGDPADLTATQVRTILNVEDGAAADQTADEVAYDNATSGLTATDVQAAVDEVAENVLPAGTSVIIWRNGASVPAPLGIGSNLSIVDNVLSALVTENAGTGGEAEEIDGSSVLTAAQQRLSYDVDGVLITRSCYVHNTANEAGAVTSSVPWDLEESTPGTAWELVRAGGYSGAWTIDRQTKTIALNGTTTNGNAVVTGIDTTDLEAGIGVSGTGIPGGTTVASINSATQLTLSANATASGSPALTFNFGKQGTLNLGTDALTVSTVGGARVTVSVVATDDPDAAPDVRVEGDLDETGSLTGDLNANGKNIYAVIGPPLTINGVLTSAHSNRPLLLDGNATIPGTAGWYGILEAVGGSRTVTFNSLTRVLASGDVMTILVKSASTYIMFHHLSANRASFS